MSYDLAVVADLCIDVLLTGKVKPIYGQVEQFVDDYQIELGGSATIFSSQFTKLGGKCAFLGAIGNDGFGELLLSRIREIGIDDRFLHYSNEKTALGLGLGYGNDRAMLTYLGTLNDIKPQLIETSGVLDAASHIHINSYFLLENLQAYWSEKAPLLKKRGKTLSLDTNWAPLDDWQKVHELLPFIDVFIPNEEEAKLISAQANLADAGMWLSEQCPLVVIKRGEKGASLFQKGTRTDFEIPSLLTDQLKIKDTTGAGDNFCAGFIFNWLKGKPLEDCVTLGMQCGTSSLKEIGGINGQFVH